MIGRSVRLQPAGPRFSIERLCGPAALVASDHPAVDTRSRACLQLDAARRSMRASPRAAAAARRGPGRQRVERLLRAHPVQRVRAGTRARGLRARPARSSSIRSWILRVLRRSRPSPASPMRCPLSRAYETARRRAEAVDIERHIIRWDAVRAPGESSRWPSFNPAVRAWLRSRRLTGRRGRGARLAARSARGDSTLIVAPTGSGKTLAAFLWWLIDRLMFGAAGRDRRRRRVVYVSPLKALAVDVERNPGTPLARYRAAPADGRGTPYRAPAHRHPHRRARRRAERAAVSARTRPTS